MNPLEQNAAIFGAIIDRLCQPTEFQKWLGSEHVTNCLAEMREMDRLIELEDIEAQNHAVSSSELDELVKGWTGLTEEHRRELKHA